MPENNPMTGGNQNNPFNAADMFSSLQSTNSNLASTTSELKRLVEFLKQHFKGTGGTQSSSSARSISNMLRDLEGVAKSLQDFQKFIKSTNKELTETIKGLEQERKNLKGATKNIDASFIDKQIKILQSYGEAIKDIEEQSKDTYKRQEIAESVRQKETQKAIKLNEEISSMASTVQDLNTRLTTMSSSTAAYASIQEQVTKMTEEVEKKQKELEQVEGIIETAERRIQTEQNKQAEIQRQISEAEKRRNEQLQNEQESHKILTESAQQADNAFRQLSQRSSILSDWISNQEKDEEESFNDAVSRTRDSLQKAIDELTKRLNEGADLTEQERENIKKDRDNLKQQHEALKNLTPASEDLHKAGKQLTEIGTNMLKGILNNITKQLESRYLTVYIDAFDRVYNSIENTRNTVSARLRLDQGGFEELQSSIMDEIDRMGLTGSVSAVDVNEALVELSSAGITDQETLQELALESAKLKAQGSSLNLSNEETMTRIMTAIQQGMSDGLSKEEALGQVTRMLEDVGQAEILAREQFGQDLSLAHGGLDAIINQALDAGTAAGKTLEQIGKDVQSGVMTSVSANVAGIDPAMIQQYYQELAAGKITEQSAFGNILLNKGLTPGELLQMSTGEAYAKIASVLQQLVQNQDPNYLASVMQNVYGLSGSTYDYMRLAKANQGVIKTEMTDEDYKRMEELNEETAKALDEGTYKSRTEQIRKKAENAVDEIALTMEQFYEGDKLFHAVTDPILGGISQVVTAIGDLGYKMIGGYITQGSSYFGSSMLGATGSTGMTAFKNFATGASGTAAGNVGRIGGALVGAGIMAHSAYSAIRDYDGAEVWEHLGTDPEFYGGLGTTLGSALAGPIGGAIGGAAGTFFSWAGNKLGDWIAYTDADEFNEAAQELKASADALTQSATDQLEQATKEYNKLANYTTSEKKVLLEQQGLITQEESVNITEDEINQRFNDTVLMEQKLLAEQAAQNASVANIVSESAAEFQNVLNEGFNYDWSAGSYANKADFIENRLGDFEQVLGGSHGNIMSNIAEMFAGVDTMSEDQMKVQLEQSGIDASKMSKEQLVESIKQSKIKEIESQVGFGEGETILFEESVRKMEERKSRYDEADAEFMTRWQDAVNKVKQERGDNFDENDYTAILSAYYQLYGVSPEIDIGNDGKVHLSQPVAGYSDSTYEGKFESGLTDVPYDGYKAILHQGERVLTSEEARAYNDLSSSVLEQISNGGNESFATYMNTVGGNAYESIVNSTTLGTDKLNASINNQTSTIEQKLDAILELLKVFIRTTRSGARVAADNKNVVMMNSNVTQLNTI